MARTYTNEDRAQVVGLAQSVGITKAAERYGVPLTTAARWMTRADLRPVRDMTRKAVAAKLWEAVNLGVDEVTAALRDPRARLGDKARALEVVAAQYALLTGGPTSRTSVMDGGEDFLAAAGLTSYDVDRLADWLDAQLIGGRTVEEIKADFKITPKQITAGEEPPDGLG